MEANADLDIRNDSLGQRKSRGFLAGDLLLILCLGLLAVNSVLGAIAYFGEPADVEVSTQTLWVGVTFNFFLFIALPVAWTLITVHGGWRGARRYLGMTGGLSDAAMGLGLGVVLVMVLGGLAYGIDALGWGPENAPITEILKNITWPLAIVISLVAGFGEEVLFRGILQRWLKWWGQGILFGALHFANAGLLAFALVGTIGLLFGYMRHRGFSLWTLIVAHFVYDIILLSVALAFPEAAGGTAAIP